MNTNHESLAARHDEINLLDYWRIILRHKKMIAGIVAAASVTAVIISLLLPKSYRAEAVIIPISAKGGSGGGLSALASQFGGLASIAGIGLPGGASEAEKIVAILKSRTLTENVVNRENLLPVLFKSQWDERNKRWKGKEPNMEMAVRAMKQAIVIVDDKKNKTIKIAGEFRKSDIAARVVNAYLDELQKFINGNAFTMAKRNRIFIEQQLEMNKEELLEAGKEISDFYSGKRISSADAKVDVQISSIAGASSDQVTSNTDSRSVAAGLQNSDADLKTQNLVIGTAEAGMPPPDPELSNLMTQQADVERKLADVRSVKSVPQQVYLSYLMLRRELLGKVNALLTSQYEMAKIDESKEDLAFQVIDKAVPPMYKFKPKRAQICIMVFMAALFGAVFLAFFREYINRMRQLNAGQG